MDSTVLQLFTTDEILERLGQKKSTGCLHLYSTRESANLFLKDGVVVATSNGSSEGVDVLKQVVTWKDLHYVWQQDVTAPGAVFKPLHVPVHDILAQLRTSSDPTRKAAASARLSGSLPAPAATLSPPVYPSIGAKGKTTGPIVPSMEPPASPTPKAALSPLAEAIAPVQLTATKNFNPTANDRPSEEAALLKKHRFVLVFVENPEMRLKITRVNGVLGRNPACEVPIPHPSISRQHCLLQLMDRGLSLKDLGTTNGTKVNGIALTEGLVNVGDKLTFGHLTFVLERDKE